jgi:hypothetical protein
MEEDWGAIANNVDEDAQWLHTDEFEDVEASLDLLMRTLEVVQDKPAYWKWAIVSAHNALQSAAVCILTQTDGSGALLASTEKALHEKLYGEDEDGRFIDREDKEWPESRLATLDELLKRLPNNLSITLPGRRSGKYGFDEPGDLRRLIEFRNKFIHFTASSWSLEIAGLPRIIRRALEKSEAIVRHPDYPRFNRFPDTAVAPAPTRAVAQRPPSGSILSPPSPSTE